MDLCIFVRTDSVIIVLDEYYGYHWRLHVNKK